MCVCIYVCMYVCIYVYIHINAARWMSRYVSTHARLQARQVLASASADEKKVLQARMLSRSTNMMMIMRVYS